MNNVQKGDEVVVTFRGTVAEVGTYGFDLRAGAPSSLVTHMVVPHSDPAFEVKVVEPEYEQDAVYRSAAGFDYQYRLANSERPWFSLRTLTYCARNIPVRPLRKLVPEDIA